MVMIQHLFGIPSLRKTADEVSLNTAYRWFLGYSMNEKTPHFFTISCNFKYPFTDETIEKVFYWILSEIESVGYLSPETVFVDGTHNAKYEKTVTKHIWDKYLDKAEDIRHTYGYKELYDKRKETIERVFADAKEKHSMRYTLYRGLTQVTNWVRLKFTAMNLKKYAIRKWHRDGKGDFCLFIPFFIRLKISV